MSIIYVIISIYLIMYFSFAKATGRFFKTIFYTAILGVLSLISINLIGGFLGFNCPINTYTLSFCSVLGMPGVIFLLLCNFIFI